MDRVASTPEPAGQRFPRGARVRVADDLGPPRAHFQAGCEAVVLYTYAHAYGGENTRDYCLAIQGASVAWYDEGHLSAVPQ
jgi:hypothetical protein